MHGDDQIKSGLAQPGQSRRRGPGAGQLVGMGERGGKGGPVGASNGAEQSSGEQTMALCRTGHFWDRAAPDSPGLQLAHHTRVLFGSFVEFISIQCKEPAVCERSGIKHAGKALYMTAYGLGTCTVATCLRTRVLFLCLA